MSTPKMTSKPRCNFAGLTDRNAIVAVVAYVLRQAGADDAQIERIRRRARSTSSLDALLQVLQEHVEIDESADPRIAQIAPLEEDLRHAEQQIEQAAATLGQPDTPDAARRVAVSTISFYRQQAGRLRLQIAAARRRMGEAGEGKENN